MLWTQAVRIVTTLWTQAVCIVSTLWTSCTYRYPAVNTSGTYRYHAVNTSGTYRYHAVNKRYISLPRCEQAVHIVTTLWTQAVHIVTTLWTQLKCLTKPAICISACNNYQCQCHCCVSYRLRWLVSRKRMWRSGRASLADNFTAKCSSSAEQPITRVTDGRTFHYSVCLPASSGWIPWLMLKGATLCLYVSFLCLYPYRDVIHQVETEPSGCGLHWRYAALDCAAGVSQRLAVRTYLAGNLDM